VAFASFSGYMSFSGEITEQSLRFLGNGAKNLLGQNINGVFQIADGVITGLFDRNMNPNESFSQMFIERGLELAASEIGIKLGTKIGTPYGVPGKITGAVAGAVVGSVIGGVNSDDFGKVLDKIVNDLGDDVFGALVTTKYDNNKEKLIFSTNSDTKLAIDKVWEGDGMMGWHIENSVPFEFRSARNKPFSFSFKDNTFNFEHCYWSSFERDRVNYQGFKGLLERLPVNGFSIQTMDVTGDNAKVIYNFLSKECTKEQIIDAARSGDKTTLYALTQFKTIILEGDKDLIDQINPNDYSQTYLEKRAQMFYNYINENKSTSLPTYHDLKTGTTLHNESTSRTTVLFGTDGEDKNLSHKLSGSFNRYIFAEKSNDTINLTSGTNYIEGGKGNDTINGGRGSDTYYFTKGDGKDTIMDNGGGKDTILFGKGISKDDLYIKAEDNNLIIAIKEDGKSFDELKDRITIKDWHKKGNKIEQIKFEDDKNTTLDEKDILSLRNANIVIKEYKEIDRNNTIKDDKSCIGTTDGKRIVVENMKPSLDININRAKIEPLTETTQKTMDEAIRKFLDYKNEQAQINSKKDSDKTMQR
jgi:Ca2+-binding RTX toxin-like protein